MPPPLQSGSESLPPETRAAEWSSLSSTFFIGLQIIFWTMTFSLGYFMSHPFMKQTRYAIYTALFVTVIGFVLSCVLGLLYRLWILQGWNLRLISLCAVPLICVFAVIWFSTTLHVIWSNEWDVYRLRAPFTLPFGSMVLGGALGTWSGIYFIYHYWNEQRAARVHSETFQRQVAEARLDKLTDQINRIFCSTA